MLLSSLRMDLHALFAPAGIVSLGCLQLGANSARDAIADMKRLFGHLDNSENPKWVIWKTRINDGFCSR